MNNNQYYINTNFNINNLYNTLWIPCKTLLLEVPKISLKLFNKFSSVDDIIKKYDNIEYLRKYSEDTCNNYYNANDCVKINKNNELIINIFNEKYDDGYEANYITSDIYYTYIFTWALYNDIVKNKYDIAITYYLKCIELENNDALRNIGILYFKTNQLEEAQKYLLISSNKGDCLAMFYLGNLYSKIFKIITEHDEKISAESFTIVSSPTLHTEKSSTKNNVSQNILTENNTLSNPTKTTNTLSNPTKTTNTLSNPTKTTNTLQKLLRENNTLPDSIFTDILCSEESFLTTQSSNKQLPYDENKTIPNIPECFIIDELNNNGKTYFYDLSIKYYLKSIEKNMSLSIQCLKDVLKMNNLSFYLYLKNIPMKSNLVKSTINNLECEIKIIKFCNRLSYQQTSNVISECILCQKIDSVLECKFRCPCQLCIHCYITTKKCPKCDDEHF